MPNCSISGCGVPNSDPWHDSVSVRYMDSADLNSNKIKKMFEDHSCLPHDYPSEK